jgi:hypothetical protein
MPSTIKEGILYTKVFANATTLPVPNAYRLGRIATPIMGTEDCSLEFQGLDWSVAADKAYSYPCYLTGYMYSRFQQQPRRLPR